MNPRATQQSAETQDCPDCGQPIPMMGKSVHRCCGEYVALFNGHLICYRATRIEAETELNRYVFDLIADGIIDGCVFDHLPDVIIPEAAFQLAAIRDMRLTTEGC